MRRLAPLLVLLLVAGCLGTTPPADPLDKPTPETWRANKVPGEPSKPIYTQILRSQIYVPSKDGTRLAAALYKPAVPDGVKLPVVLVITPYEVFVTSQPTQVDPGLVPDGSPSAERDFAPRGYAVVTANVRGTGNSDGCYDNRGTKEREDGYALVEYFAAQPWSNGRVGMTGGSYLGSTQWTTAASNPPHLVTVMPSSATVSVYRHLNRNGVQTGSGNNAAYYGIGAVPGLDVARTGYAEGRVADARCDHVTGLTADTESSGDWNQFWDERDVEKDAANVTASVFVSHGFLDTTVGDHMTSPSFSLLTTPKRALIGQWGHAVPTVPPAYKQSWMELTTRWFDYWLKDIDTGVMDEPAVLIQDSGGAWHEFDAWPPRAPDGTLRLHLSNTGNDPSKGRLVAQAPTGTEPSHTFVAALTPRTVNGQPTELRFVSEPLTEALAVIGVPQATLTGSTSANQQSYWVAILHDVNGDTWNRFDVGYQNLRHRDGVKSPQPIQPGTAYTFAFDMTPDAYVIPAGHRIGLIVRGTDPDATADANQPTNVLYHDAEHPAFLDLPVPTRP